jgi:O-antigen/teichoic acid export membrane protein
VLGKLVVQCACNTYFVAVLKLGVDGVLAGNCLAVLFGWLVLVGYTVRHCGLGFQWAKVLPLLQYSLPFLYTTIVTVLVANLDRFLIAKLLSLEAMGLYALATRFSKLIGDLVGEPFARSYGAFRYTVMDRPDAAAIQAQVVRLLAGLLAVISLGLVLFTADVLHLMSDRAFWPAARLMPLLCLASSVSTLNYAFQTGVLVKKTTHELFRVSLIQNGVGVVASVVLMFAWGVHGACLAVLINASLGAWLTHRASQRHFPVQYDLKRLGGLTMATAVAMVLALALAELPLVLGLALKLLFFVGFAVAVFRSPVVDPEERAMLVGRIGGLTRRLRRQA